MDCLIVDDDEMSRNVVKHFIEKTKSLNLIGMCSDGFEAANILHNTDVDILFLDIEMPGMSGYELIKSMTNPAEIILITAKAEHAVEAFEYRITDYLLKPISYPRFLQSIFKVQENMAGVKGRTKAKELYVRSDSKIIKASFDDILYIEALADYIMIITTNNKYIVHSTMKGFQSRLPENQFARVHRSYIINKDKIDTIENLFVVIAKKYIPIGASYKDDFIGSLNML
ncbi:MAG TPA: LytTR family DNA-binding domain-containing protein [Cytophagaceae bacterium]|jgi:DNA-binding LytR/AlgR family response regulator|nr:LytTR family DNA-binding domain-containing protein [Cytophagaceae bacterium]